MRQVFLIPEDKKVKFAALREDVISSPFMGLKTLQRFSGKVISFSFSIQRCRLYVLYCIFKAISRLSGSTRSPVKVEAALRAETEYWRFLDNWRDCFPWRTTPLCGYTLLRFLYEGLGWNFAKDGRSLESRDYWEDNSQDINILKARALQRSLLSLKHHISS